MLRIGCERVERRLGAYRDGALGRWRRRRVEAHLLQCPRCRGNLQSFQRIGQALRDHPVARLSPLQAETLVAGVRQRIATRGMARGSHRWRLLDGLAWLRETFVVHPRMTWGTAAVLAGLLISFAGADLGRRLFGLGAPTASMGPIVVESLEAGPQTSVMLFAPPHSNLRVIWIFEQPPDG